MAKRTRKENQARVVLDPHAAMDDGEYQFLDDLARRFQCQFVQLHLDRDFPPPFKDEKTAPPAPARFEDRASDYDCALRKYDSFLLRDGHVVELYVRFHEHGVEEKPWVATIPPTITCLEHLESLTVGTASLLPEAIRDLPRLRHLWSQEVATPRLPSFFFDCPRLEFLKVEFADNLKELPDTFDRLPHLRYLEVENSRRLRSVPASLFTLEHLETLSLHADRLSSIPDTIANLRALRHLYFSHNWLREIPPAITTLRNLEGLGLDHNALTSLPPDLGNLHNLKTLSIGENHLAHLPVSLEAVTGLEDLSVNSNDLTALPNLEALQSLVYIFASDNEITEFPRGIGNQRGLITLDLEINCITELPPDFSPTERMRRLVMAGNPLTPSARAMLASFKNQVEEVTY